MFEIWSQGGRGSFPSRKGWEEMGGSLSVSNSHLGHRDGLVTWDAKVLVSAVLVRKGRRKAKVRILRGKSVVLVGRGNVS